MAPDGSIIYEHTPTVVKTMDVSHSTWEAVIDGMEAVITHPRGTARRIFQDFPLALLERPEVMKFRGRKPMLSLPLLPLWMIRN